MVEEGIPHRPRSRAESLIQQMRKHLPQDSSITPLQGTHCVRFELIHCQDAYIVSDVWWHPKLSHQYLHQFSVTTPTSQV